MSQSAPILQLVPGSSELTQGGRDPSPSLDCLVPSKGYVVGNVAVISKRANNIKSNASPEELERVLTWVRAALGKG
jgi:hypothetical protein